MIRKIYIRDLGSSIEGIRRTCPEALQDIIAWADEAVSGIICHRAHYEMEKCFTPVRFSDSIWDNVPAEIANRDPEWLYALSRHSILLNLAKAFAFTGDKRYRDSFIRMMESYLTVTSCTAEHFSTSWRSLETGIRPENWVRSIELFEASGAPLPDSLLSCMEDALHDHIRQLEDTHRAFQRLSNWGVIQDHGLFIAGAAVGDDDAVSIALSRLEEELTHQALSCGEHWEQSPMYHLEVLHSAIDTVLAARRLGIAMPQAVEEKTKLLSKGLYDMTLPGGSIILTGDSDEMDASDLIYLAAYLFSLPFDARKAEENWWDLGSEEKGGDAEERKSVFHQASGNAFLRSGTLTAHMVSGLLGSGHGHISPLHVDIAIGDRVIVTDAGRFTYTDTAEREMLKDAASHNVFMLDGHFPEKASGSWSYSGIFEKTLSASLGEGGYDAASGMYFGYLSSGLVERRKTLRISDKIVVVIDEALGDEEKEHDYRAFWHMHPEAVISDDMSIRCGDSSIYVSTTAESRGIGKYRYSPVYNVLEEASMLTLGSRIRGMGAVATVFSIGERAEVRTIDAHLIDSGRHLSDTEAIALSIRRSDGEWIVLSRSHEIVAQVDIIKAGFLEGYGRLLVQEKGDRFPSRLM